MIPPLDEHTILMVEVGSTAYGTGIDDQDDIDQMVVTVEQPEVIFRVDPARDETRLRVGPIDTSLQTVMHRTAGEGEPSGPDDIDRTVYPLRRWLKLAAKGNPSILTGLWSPVVYVTPLGHELRQMADAFVGRHIIPRYQGYMRSQALRLVGMAGNRGHGPQRAHLVEQFGFDTKYAMHSTRLGYQCIELLETGKLTMPIAGPEGEWLRQVRRGEISFENWWATALKLYDLLEQLKGDEGIPPGPRIDEITHWSTMAHMRSWNA